jgi:hypothetical protein
LISWFVRNNFAVNFRATYEKNCERVPHKNPEIFRSHPQPTQNEKNNKALNKKNCLYFTLIINFSGFKVAFPCTLHYVEILKELVLKRRNIYGNINVNS